MSALATTAGEFIPAVVLAISYSFAIDGCSFATSGIFGAVNVALLHIAFAFLLNMVCNAVMNTLDRDREIIRQHGGPSKVASLIGIDKRGGAQRVQNWLVRGVPAAIKVKNPHIFMPELLARQPSMQPQEA